MTVRKCVSLQVEGKLRKLVQTKVPVSTEDKDCQGKSIFTASNQLPRLWQLHVRCNIAQFAQSYYQNDIKDRGISSAKHHIT